MELMDQVVREKRTTGPKQSPEYAEYTHLNQVRMHRLNKTVVLSAGLKEAINDIVAPQTWYVITEAWCGDAAQNIPVIARAAAHNPVITLTLLLRDENPDVMDRYLTNGGRSIPKLIAVDTGYNELFTWGPRPEKAQQLLAAYQANPVKSIALFTEEIQRWYAADKTQSVQNELTEVIRKSANKLQMSNA